MNTPICDFVRDYAGSGTLRMHMPGHKGVPLTGFEPADITEISGADSLYEADGIIAESEKNASALFGADTFYSTEGSSLCIRAMLYLASVCGAKPGGQVKILAGRNAHKTFLSAAALLDLDVRWIFSEESHLSCRIDPAALDSLLTEDPVTAVYVTSPDYLGNTVDIASIAAVCHRHGALLLVDNAHGAYLKFLPESRHPMDLGADICCDSAHKTLPALTGAAYLHLSPSLPACYRKRAKSALALFGSTSPSYLLLQSLDAVNAYLADGYRERLAATVDALAALTASLEADGWHFCGDEPMKLTFAAKQSGHTGTSLAELLREKGIECEFADPDYLVLMPTPESGDDLEKIRQAFRGIPVGDAIAEKPPVFNRPVRAMSIRQAVLSPAEIIPAEEACGRILAAATVGCPPAVPIVVCGERMDEQAVRCFAYYGIETCLAVKGI